MIYRQLVKNGNLLMYKIKYKDTSNITAKIDKNNDVVVTCPEGIDIQYIDNFVLEHFDKFFNFLKTKKEQALIDLSTNKISLLGVNYNIIIQLTNGKEKYEIINNKVYLFLRNEENKKKIIAKLLTTIGKDYLIKKTRYWLKIMNENAFSIQTKWYESKWGQCDYRQKEITLAIQLYMLNEALIDYVIIHEIAHLSHPNHSVDFWKTVEKYYPNYKIAKNKMKFVI